MGDTLLNDEPLGVQRYAYEILKHLDLLDLSYECEMLIPKCSKCTISFNNIKIIRYGLNRKGFLWRQIDFPRYLKKEKAIGVDLTLGLPILRCDVVCLHDCIYENYKDDFRSLKEKIKRLSYLIRAYVSINRSKLVLTVSEFSKKELIEYYKVPEKKIHVVYNAWQHYKRIVSDTTILERLKLTKGEYFFALGSSLPHKNFQWIIRAAKNNSHHMFVITGTNRLSNYKDTLDIKDISNIIFTGFLKDNEVKALMENCKAFLHPSFYEGFGIPPLEALSCQAKTLVANSSCLPEIYRDSVTYFDPHDENIDLDALLNNKEKDEIDATIVLKKYSWVESANKVNLLLKELIKGNSSL